MVAGFGKVLSTVEQVTDTLVSEACQSTHTDFKGSIKEELDHLCCNPVHLGDVPHATNVRRGMGWFQDTEGSWYCKYLHKLEGWNIIYAKKQIGCRECKNAQARERRARNKL